MAEKCAGLRLFSDAEGKMNLGLAEVGGALLVVSQFTLYATPRRESARASSTPRVPRSRSRSTSASSPPFEQRSIRLRLVNSAR